jgi:hypothetical protein
MVRIWKQCSQDMEVVYLHYELEMVLGRYILLLLITVLANNNHIQRVKALSVSNILYRKGISRKAFRLSQN